MWVGSVTEIYNSGLTELTWRQKIFLEIVWIKKKKEVQKGEKTDGAHTGSQWYRDDSRAGYHWLSVPPVSSLHL